jgi:hypothetical protein
MTSTTLAFVALVALMGAVLVIGLVAAARRAAMPPRAVTRLGAAVAAAIVAWLALAFFLARAGVFRAFDAAPPRVVLLPLTVLATMLVLSRTRRFQRLLAAAPWSWPIGLQAFRVAVELVLWKLHTEGRIPVQMTFEGRNFDILVGATAPLVAWAVARGHAGRGPILAWNLVSLGLLANIVGVAMTSFPGPLNAGWSGGSSALVAEAPFVWLPGFLVPLAVFGHVASLQQLRAAAAGRSPSSLAQPARSA